MLEVVSITGTKNIDLSGKMRPMNQQGIVSPNYHKLIY